MADDKNKQLFLSLIYSFQMQTMMQLGKLTNPMTNTTEKELDGAQVTIDMLDMLKAKTKNNIGDDESKFLDQIIADLKLNYVEERDKEKSGEKNTDDKKISSAEKTETKEKSKLKNTEDKGKSSAKETDSKEKSEAKSTEDKKDSSAEETDSKEKPLTEQIKDYENPLPPQE